MSEIKYKEPGTVTGIRCRDGGERSMIVHPLDSGENSKSMEPMVVGYRSRIEIEGGDRWIGLRDQY
jgi:hypothetical protein